MFGGTASTPCTACVGLEPCSKDRDSSWLVVKSCSAQSKAMARSLQSRDQTLKKSVNINAVVCLSVL